MKPWPALSEQASRAIASGDPETALGELADRLAALQEGVEALGTLEGTQAGLRSARSVISGVALVQAPGGRAVGEEQQEGGGSAMGTKVRVARTAMVKAREKVGQVERAAGVLAPVAARAEAARVTNRGVARETRPADFSPKGRLFSYRATAREFPRRCGRALAKESPLEGSGRITKSWENTRSRPGNIWNEARCPKAIRTWCAATLRSWSGSCN